MVKISVLHRHGTYEEFESAEIDMSPSERILMVYDEEGRISHMVPFDSVASIDFIYEEDEEEATNPIDEINNRPGGFAPHSHTLNTLDYTFHKDNY